MAPRKTPFRQPSGRPLLSCRTRLRCSRRRSTTSSLTTGSNRRPFPCKLLLSHRGSGGPLRWRAPAVRLFAHRRHPVSACGVRRCECMTLGSETWSGCCVHHSHAKGLGCHVHHHLFRVAAQAWLHRRKRPPSLLVVPDCDCGEAHEAAARAHLADAAGETSALTAPRATSLRKGCSGWKRQRGQGTRSNCPHTPAPPSCRRSKRRLAPGAVRRADARAARAKADEAAAKARGGSCSRPTPVQPASNRTVCFEKLVLTPHRAHGEGRSMRGGDPMLLFGKVVMTRKAARAGRRLALCGCPPLRVLLPAHATVPASPLCRPRVVAAAHSPRVPYSAPPLEPRPAASSPRRVPVRALRHRP